MPRRIGPVPFADAVLFFLIFLPAFVLCLRATRWPPATYHASSNQDVWFDADTMRVFQLESDRASVNARAELHPLERIVTYPPAFLLRKASGLGGEQAVELFHSLISALWIASFFLLLRSFGLRRVDAAAFTGVLGTSATALFWMPVTEVFIAGSLTMFPALAIAARPDRVPLAAHWLSAVAAFGITLTNGMAAVFSSLVTLTRRRFAAVMALAAAAVIAGAWIETLAFPVKQAVLANPSIETAWVFPPESGGPFAILRTFFLAGVVAPEISFQRNWLNAAWPFLSFQCSRLPAASPWGWFALVAWLSLLGLGVRALAREKRPLKTVLSLILLYQLFLHLVYGRETFLYAPHYVPLLVAVAAFATATPRRPLVLALAAGLAIANVLNAAAVLPWARAYAGRHAALKKVEGRVRLPVENRTEMDAAVRYRFWRDVLGWGEKR